MVRLVSVCVAIFILGCTEETSRKAPDKQKDHIGLSHEKAAAIHKEHMQIYRDMTLQELTDKIGATTYATASQSVNGVKVYSYEIKTSISSESEDSDFVEVMSVLTEVLLDESKNTKTVSRKNLVMCKNQSVLKCRE